MEMKIKEEMISHTFFAEILETIDLFYVLVYKCQSSSFLFFCKCNFLQSYFRSYIIIRYNHFLDRGGHWLEHSAPVHTWIDQSRRRRLNYLELCGLIHSIDPSCSLDDATSRSSVFEIWDLLYYKSVRRGQWHNM